MPPFKKLNLLLLLLLLIFSRSILAKIPTIPNLGTIFFFGQIENKRILSAAYNSRDFRTVSERINTAIPSRQVRLLDEPFMFFSQVIQTLTNCAFFNISIEFPTHLATSIADGLLICGAVQGSGTDLFVDISAIKPNSFQHISQNTSKTIANKIKDLPEIVI